MSSEAPSSGIDPSLIAAALGDISSDDEPVLPSKRRCRKRKSASPSPPVSPIHKSDSDDEGPSLADRYKERLANEIKKNLEKISNMEKEEDAQGKPVTKKRRAIASWIDATLRPSDKTSTGPGCSICISTFEEIQMEGLELYSTPCGHIYCKSCLSGCLKSSGPNCPKCRKKITMKKCHPIFPDLIA